MTAALHPPGTAPHAADDAAPWARLMQGWLQTLPPAAPRTDLGNAGMQPQGTDD